MDPHFLQIMEKTFGRDYRLSDEMNTATWLDRARIKECRSFWPRQCYMSKKWLWLKSAIRTECVFTGPGDPIYETRWYDRKELINWRLRNG